jgi:hypothetical protein
VRVRVPSFSIALRTWLFTVSREITSCSAISTAVNPAASSVSISRSRGVRMKEVRAASAGASAMG